MSAGGKVVLHKVWRSEVERLIIFACLCIAAVVLSHFLPGTLIRGEIITIGSTKIWFTLPLFALMPLTALGDLLARIYDVRYTLSAEGIESREGIVSLSQRVTRIRFEDIRLIEVDQTLLQRFLGVGNVIIGTAATDTVEVRMRGIEAPAEIQRMVQAERDKRQQLEGSAHNTIERAGAAENA